MPEDPYSWLIEAAGAVVEKVMRTQAYTHREPMRAALAILKPALRVMQDVIEQYVPAEQRQACKEFFSDGVSKVVVPAR